LAKGGEREGAGGEYPISNKEYPMMKSWKAGGKVERRGLTVVGRMGGWAGDGS
jgi:hypothetical protein